MTIKSDFRRVELSLQVDVRRDATSKTSVFGLKKLFEAQLLEDEAASIFVHPPQKREADKEVFLAVDSAMLDANGWGMDVFEVARAVGPLPATAERYFVEYQHPLTETTARRPAFPLHSGSNACDL